MIRTTTKSCAAIHEISTDLHDGVLTSTDLRSTQVFNAEWDDEGVYFYQAYRDEIANYAVEHQRFGGKHWNPSRMTWIKPSFGWVLYRSGYAKKSGQERILKVKLSHDVLAELLCRCKLARTQKGSDAVVGGTTTHLGDHTHNTRTSCKEGIIEVDVPEGEGSLNNTDKGTCIGSKLIRVGGKGGRIQWDPARDLSTPDSYRGKRQPRKMIRAKDIQIGLSAGLSEYYVENAMLVEDVTALAHAVEAAHGKKNSQETEKAMPWADLPKERPYMPILSVDVLLKLGMLPKHIEEWRKIKKNSLDKL